MPAPVKIGRTLAALILNDLPHSIADMAENYGVKPPQVALKHGDRLSQSDARTLYAWAVGNPDFRAAYSNTQNPAHGVARAFLALTQHFLHDHPQSGGEPAPWPEPLSPAIGALMSGTRDRIEASELRPSEAAEMLQWAQMMPDHGAALHDRGHAEHAEVAREWQALHEKAAESLAAPPGAPKGAVTSETTKTRIAELTAELRGNQRFGSAERQAKTAELYELLAGTVTQPAAVTAPASIVPTVQPGAAKSPAVPADATKTRIAELTAELRGNTRFGSAERQGKTAELYELLAGTAPNSAGGTESPAGG
jgi:hypothetical protein